MESRPLLQGLQLTSSCRITSTDKKNAVFPRDYPGMLNGIMREDDFIEYLKRIEAAKALENKGTGFIMIVGPLLVISVILHYAYPGIELICFGVTFGLAIILLFIMLCITQPMYQTKSNTEIREIIDEINSAYRPHGLRWSFTQNTADNPCCIDITLLTPGSQQLKQPQQGYNADPWANLSSAASEGTGYSSETSLMPSHGPTYSTFEQPSAPPLVPPAGTPEWPQPVLGSLNV